MVGARIRVQGMSRRLAYTWVIALVAACGYPDPQGDATRTPLPDRTRDGGADGEVPDEDAGIIEASTVNPEDATTPSTLCTANDLALCLAFEGNVNDGSPNKLAVTASNVGFGAGRAGQGAVLSGVSQMSLGPSAVFDATEITVEAWIKLSASALGDAVVFDADNRYSLTVTAARQVWCKSSGGAVMAGAVTPEQWTHVACVVGGGSVRAYVNGGEVGAQPGAVVASPASAQAVGSNCPSGEPFVGVLDSVRVFRVARSGTEIAAAAKP